MELDAVTITNLLGSVGWETSTNLRLFWIKIPHGSRDALAVDLRAVDDTQIIVPVVLREPLFLSANAVMSDFSRLLESNRQSFESLKVRPGQGITVVLLLKESFNLSQISSPVILPRWFPIQGGVETYLHISDLLWCAETELLNCSGAQIALMSSSLFELESSIVERLRQVSLVHPGKVRALLDTINQGGGGTVAMLDGFSATLNSVKDPKGYRPNSKTKNSFISLVLAQVLKSSPGQLSSLAEKFQEAVADISTEQLRPTLFGIMLRPSNETLIPTKNWHSLMLATFQVYQLMNASAHAGEYPKYPVSLISSNARDLLEFLVIANKYVAFLFEGDETVDNVAG
ncbi:hypothetical protein ACDH60_24525 [Pseudomonas ficuserectae]|uniref:hypothetical protein n=1 Tax=Pseudomonas syringae group genomosp. 2 TaxID=251698 RepID=UPI00062BE85A|nr:hypothetical protein [Pseudomonas amygdali]KKY58926.1 hypothetical protein AAY85_05155 [Pseudomonas amygdali pv. lachrymans]KPB97077.1 Uncharacterized protein AC501_4602 [Pseudomonas amygdali pv. lachrymans]RMM51264.1 hypothetical protein ALQ79_01144 [Pseudomonas amygdali pv. lachrymans]RMP25333.1 hypothetical protein ALQ26_01835 [Pseudomonas amygdali pv. lachrymans]WIO56650.1 hypothetical protein QO021_19115 [Pseudomonas amygdali pv. lachrymans]